MKRVKTKPKQPGNYIDAFVKKMFGNVLVFTDFLVNYADKRFVEEIDTTKIQRLVPSPQGGRGRFLETSGLSIWCSNAH